MGNMEPNPEGKNRQHNGAAASFKGGALLWGSLLFILLLVGTWFSLQNQSGEMTLFTLAETPTGSPAGKLTRTPTLLPVLTRTPVPTMLPVEIRSCISEKDGMTLMYVPAGEFLMGSESGRENEKPVHRVFLEAYWIDQSEVTNAMYLKCVMDGACSPPRDPGSDSRADYFGVSEFNDYPVVNVTWGQAQTYCKWAGRYLPSEAEWEKAARGSDGRTYPWGEWIDCEKANYLGKPGGCAGGDTSNAVNYPAGASPYGALNMAGNVWEWVADWYDQGYYRYSPDHNPTGPNSPRQGHVFRGGAWTFTSSDVRTSFRSEAQEDFSDVLGGFRCAASP
jgi:eukaryotic-like serine/threonine-protein kinase